RIAEERGGSLRFHIRGGDRQADGIDALRRDYVAYKWGPGAGRTGAHSALRIVNGVQRSRAGLTLREIADALQRGRRVELGSVGLNVRVSFPRQPEERLVAAIVDLGDPDRAAEALTVGAVRLLGQRNPGGVVEEVVGRPGSLTHGAEQATVIIVGAG